jgi:8-oxo-dGTP pyrophosphatase MutT (NUDIX family)/RimJ/RimL family protein N-acetyltransferase
MVVKVIDNFSNFNRKGNLVYIKQPDFQELDYTAELWSDEETMRDVGGVIPFPLERRETWYRKMVNPTDGKNFYCLIYTLDDVPVGEVSFHRFDDKEGKADFNIKVQSMYRGKGYAKEAIQLLLGYYFYNFGGQVIYDNVANANGQKVLHNFGFEVVSKTGSEVLFIMTKERFMALLNENGLRYEKCCGAVINRNKHGFIEFLLVKSKDDDHWGFPKGHMEENEDEVDTTLREVYEETGLNIKIIDKFRVETEYFVSIYVLKKVIYFIGISNDTNVKIQTEEIGDYKWLSFEDAMKLLTYESAKTVLNSAKEFLNTSI